MNFLLDASLVAIIIKTLILFGAFYLFAKQLNEVFRPIDGLSRLRWQILSVLALSITSAIPSLVYQFIRFSGSESEMLRSVATVTNNFSQLAIVVLLIMIFNYKRRDK